MIETAYKYFPQQEQKVGEKCINCNLNATCFESPGNTYVLSYMCCTDKSAGQCRARIMWFFAHKHKIFLFLFTQEQSSLAYLTEPN